VNTPDLVGILRDFHRDKLTLRQRHVAVARHVSDYDFNNTYQYIIAREDVHLSWLEGALGELGEPPADVAEPTLTAPGRRESFLPLVTDDAREADALVSRWRPRLAEVTHARHRNMMQVILGETMEHKRFFDQMLAGREDLLGRRANGPGSPGTGDGVSSARWKGAD
jgi:ParB-like chromosome segregation protein Spo0J